MDGSVDVLYVANDSRPFTLTAELLQNEEEITIDRVTHPDEGLEQLAYQEFDCVVSAYKMPGMDGIEFLDAVRDTYDKLPFILFPEEGSEMVASKALSKGATEYLQNQAGEQQYESLATTIHDVTNQYQTERLEATHRRVRTIARDINQALVRASSSEEIEHAVCDRIADSDLYASVATIGVDTETMQVEPRTLGGAEAEYVDHLRMSIENEALGQHTPVEKAYHEGEIAVSKNIVTDFEDEDTLDVASDSDVRSLAIIPLEYDTELYGLLAVFTTRTTAFEQKEKAALSQLGDDIGYALHHQSIESALRRRNEEFSTIVENSPYGVALIDHDDGDFMYRQVNPRMETLSGLSADTIQDKTPQEALGPEDGDEVEATYRECVARSEVVEYTSSFEIAGNSVVRKVKVIPVSDGEDVDQLMTIVRDITDQHNREKRLREYEAAIDTVPDGVYILNDDFEFTMVNDGMAEITGYSTEELLGSRLSLVCDEEDIQRGRQKREQLRSGGSEQESLDVEIHTADGGTRTCEIRGRLLNPDDDSARTAGVFRDITERKTQERKRNRIIERVTDAIVEVDSDWQFTLVNDQAEDLYGMAEADLLGRDFWDVFAEARGTRFETEYREVMESREPTSLVEYYPELDGWFDIQVYPREGGGIAFYFRDVTERKQRERELAQSESRYRALAENFPNGGVFYFDDELRYQIVSGEGFNPIETSPEDLVGNTIDEVEPYSDEIVETLRPVMERTLQGEREIIELSYEGHIYELRTAPVRDEQGTITAGLYITRDVTEHREREENLRRQKERLDEFASIVSHDLRNPLTVAVNWLEIVKEECESEHLEKIEQSHDRMETLLNDMLSLARQGETVSETEHVFLGEILETCWDTVETANATLSIEGRCSVHADKSRLKQLVENLFRNAVDHGGEDVTITVGCLPDGFYIEDDGKGIPADEREDVFSTGYTTSDEGTGLGLNIVDEIAKAHGWEITLTDAESGGARFEITGVRATGQE